MLNEKGFDLWSGEYDRSVRQSDEDHTYPFAGYRDLLNRIGRRVLRKDHPVILDIGFGTGVLTAGLYEQGCTVWGQDFSGEMLRAAQEKMPDAHLFQGDFSVALAEPILQNRYDFILATYSLHHLQRPRQTAFLHSLRGLLKDGGEILIGDVAFRTAEELDQCRRESGDDWDEDEIYFVYEDLRRDFPELQFEPVSVCAGMLTLGKEGCI